MDWSGDTWALEENASTAFNQTMSNESLTCLARSIQMPEELPYSATFIKTVAALQAIHYFLIFLFGTSTNILLTILVAKYKRLQNHSFGIALQIAAIDEVVSVLYFAGAISIIADRWVLGEYTCVFAGMLLFVYSDVRTLLMFVFVINRFLFVFLPFSYPKYHQRVIIILSVVTWALPLAASILPIPDILDCFQFNTVTSTCSFTSRCGRGCSIFSSMNYTLVAIPATVLPMVLYTMLYIKAKKLKKATATVSDSKEGNQQDWKATITFFILFISLFAATFPTVTVNFIISRLYKIAETPPAVYGLSVASFAVLTSLPAIDSIVIMRNQDVRETLHDLKEKTIKKWCCKSEQAKQQTVKNIEVRESRL